MDALELMKTRRSSRRFLDDPVEKEKLDKVIEAGRYAPSGGNNQSTHFIVIQNKAVLAEIIALVRQEFAKMEITEHTYKSMAASIKSSKQGTYVFTYNAPVLILLANKINYGNNMADCVCAVENMLLEANALDMGACYLNQINWLNENPLILDFLYNIGMKKDETVYVSMALGYADTPDGRPVRTLLERKGNFVTLIE